MIKDEDFKQLANELMKLSNTIAFINISKDSIKLSCKSFSYKADIVLELTTQHSYPELFWQLEHLLHYTEQGELPEWLLDNPYNLSIKVPQESFKLIADSEVRTLAECFELIRYEDKKLLSALAKQLPAEADSKIEIKTNQHRNYLAISYGQAVIYLAPERGALKHLANN